MRRIGWEMLLIAPAVVVLTSVTGSAQSTTTPTTDPAAAARQEALASVAQNRETVIQETVDRWRSQLPSAVPSQNIQDEGAALRAALERAPVDRLLAASQAQTYEELADLLRDGWEGASVVPLEPGQSPNTLGSTSGDLVFTPVTPCRIIDTRSATGAFAGRIGPNTGKQFSVNLANYSAQGGFAGSCGLSTAFDVSGVVINVTSTDQTGPGNLRVVECGGGVPNVSLVNYTPGVNLANAVAARSAIGCSLGGDIFIYSGVSASHVVVDILGYFAAPVATALSCLTTANTATSEAAGVSFSLNAAACPAGYTSVSVNCRTSTFDTVSYASVGVNTGGAQCQGTNTSASTITMYVSQQCCRVPGR
jgi:hypothetical protein